MYRVFSLLFMLIFLCGPHWFLAMGDEDCVLVPLMSDIQLNNYSTESYTLMQDKDLFKYASTALKWVETSGKTLDDIVNGTPLGNNFGNVTPELLSQVRHLIKNTTLKPQHLNPSVIALLHMLMPYNTQRMQEIHTAYSQEVGNTKLYRFLNNLNRCNSIPYEKSRARSLNLSSSYLCSVHDFKPHKWGHILHLDLSYNELLYSYLNKLSQCFRLKTINLSNNKIRDLTQEELECIPPLLEKLDLSDNLIEKFPLDVALYKKEGLILNITGNPCTSFLDQRQLINATTQPPCNYNLRIKARRCLLAAGLLCCGIGAAGMVALILSEEHDAQWYVEVNIVAAYIHRYACQRFVPANIVSEIIANTTALLLKQGEWTHNLRSKVLMFVEKYASKIERRLDPWWDLCARSNSECIQRLNEKFKEIFSIDIAKKCIFPPLTKDAYYYKQAQECLNSVYIQDPKATLASKFTQNCFEYDYANNSIAEYPITFHYTRENTLQTWHVALGVLGGLAFMYTTWRIMEIFWPHSLQGYRPCVITTHVPERNKVKV